MKCRLVMESQEKNHYKYVAFFDLDRTLIDAVSGRIMAWQAFRKGLLNAREIFQAGYLSFMHKFELMENERIMIKMAEWLKGISEESLIRLGEEVGKKRLIKAVYPQVYPEIKMHRDGKAKLVILSAALSYACLAIKNHLGFDDAICSHLEIVDGKFTGLAEGKMCYGKEKLARVEAYCRDNKFNLKNAYYYADSIADLSVLDAVGHPVCINPDKWLYKVARHKSWIIRYWKKMTLQKILDFFYEIKHSMKRIISDVMIK